VFIHWSKNDAGTVTLNGVTTIPGNVNIGNTTTNGGTLRLGVAGAIPNTVLTVFERHARHERHRLDPTSIVMGGGPTLTSANINHEWRDAHSSGGYVTYNTGAEAFSAHPSTEPSRSAESRAPSQPAIRTAADPDPHH